jgi:NADPH:quinone reductase-like Zn-dependent oxidoreductase
MAKKMKVTIFVEPGRIALDEKPIPEVGPLDALVRVTTTTICVTDVHIMKGEYPVAKGLTIGHEPVGVIEKIGSAVVGSPKGSASLPERSRRAPGATPASAASVRRTVPARSMAGRRLAAGNSATPSTAVRPNTRSSPTPWPILRGRKRRDFLRRG